MASDIDRIIATCRRDSRCVSGIERRMLCDEIERLRKGHCEDCCCANAWKALGITNYTGRSIPEEIERLRAELAECQRLLRELVVAWDNVDVLRNPLHSSSDQRLKLIPIMDTFIDAAKAAGGGDG